jgi:hypothetical protein
MVRRGLWWPGPFGRRLGARAATSARSSSPGSVVPEIFSGAAVYLPRFGVTISVLSWRVVVLLRRWLTCSSSSTSCLLRWFGYCLSPFAGVRSLARVKALLGVADADHDDTCGCHFLLEGVFLGRAAPPLHARGNPRFDSSDRPAAALRRRPLLEGVVLAARALRLFEMVASPVQGSGAQCAPFCTLSRLLPFLARPCHRSLRATSLRRMSRGSLVWAT